MWRAPSCLGARVLVNAMDSADAQKYLGDMKILLL